MTHSGRPTPPLVAAILGALLGAVIAAMAKGAQIGWDQTDAGWGWLSVPVGAFSGPLLLLADLLVICGKGPAGALVALPWAGVGAIVGMVAGFLSNQD